MKNKIIGGLLGFFGVKEQLKEDLTKLVALVGVIVTEVQNDRGPGGGAQKREEALDRFFNSVEAEGGIDLPGWVTGDLGRRAVGVLIDFLVDVANGEDDSGN